MIVSHQAPLPGCVPEVARRLRDDPNLIRPTVGEMLTARAILADPAFGSSRPVSSFRGATASALRSR
jgi:hypothetical protein